MREISVIPEKLPVDLISFLLIFWLFLWFFGELLYTYKMNISIIHGNGFSIHSFEPGKIILSEENKNEKIEYTNSIILLPNKVIQWPIGKLNDLKEDDFKNLIHFEPELILLGTGEKLIFPAQSLLVDIYATRIGIEVMDTKAACRTYTILNSDGRKVLAALII
jgi:uncharacterized protein